MVRIVVQDPGKTRSRRPIYARHDPCLTLAVAGAPASGQFTVTQIAHIVQRCVDELRPEAAPANQPVTFRQRPRPGFLRVPHGLLTAAAATGRPATSTRVQCTQPPRLLPEPSAPETM